MTHIPKLEMGIMPSVRLAAREHGHPAGVEQSSRAFLVLDNASLLASQNSLGQLYIVASGRVDSDIRRAGVLGDEFGIAERALNDLYAKFTNRFLMVFAAHECCNFEVLEVRVVDEPREDSP